MSPKWKSCLWNWSKEQFCDRPRESSKCKHPAGTTLLQVVQSAAQFSTQEVQEFCWSILYFCESPCSNGTSNGLRMNTGQWEDGGYRANADLGAPRFWNDVFLMVTYTKTAVKLLLLLQIKYRVRSPVCNLHYCMPVAVWTLTSAYKIPARGLCAECHLALFTGVTPFSTRQRQQMKHRWNKGKILSQRWGHRCWKFKWRQLILNSALQENKILLSIKLISFR